MNHFGQCLSLVCEEGGSDQAAWVACFRVRLTGVRAMVPAPYGGRKGGKYCGTWNGYLPSEIVCVIKV